MPSTRVLSIFTLSVLLPLPLAIRFLWNSLNILPTWQANRVDNRVTNRRADRISHQVASAQAQHDLEEDMQWFDADGTPLIYSAWKARPSAGVSPEPDHRSALRLHGARIACWPSSGGVWIKQADVVDINFLNLSTSNDVARQFDQSTEDKFCVELKMLGAQWWALPPDFSTRAHFGRQQYACNTLEECFEPRIKNKYLFAWPESKRVACYAPLENVKEAAAIRISLTVNMDDRCDAMGQLGGHWCPCKAACPELQYLDWGSRDPGEEGCDTPPYELYDVETKFEPPRSPELTKWAENYCVDNGWKRIHRT